MSNLLASLDRIREYLQTAPRQELENDWARVKAMKLEGPTYDELVAYKNEALINTEFSGLSAITFTNDPHLDPSVVFVTIEGLLSHTEEFFFFSKLRQYCS